MGKAKYPLELFQRVVTVSLRAVEIVKGLPELDTWQVQQLNRINSD